MARGRWLGLHAKVRILVGAVVAAVLLGISQTVVPAGSVGPAHQIVPLPLRSFGRRSRRRLPRREETIAQAAPLPCGLLGRNLQSHPRARVVQAAALPGRRPRRSSPPPKRRSHNFGVNSSGAVVLPSLQGPTLGRMPPTASPGKLKRKPRPRSSDSSLNDSGSSSNSGSLLSRASSRLPWRPSIRRSLTLGQHCMHAGSPNADSDVLKSVAPTRRPSGRSELTQSRQLIKPSFPPSRPLQRPAVLWPMRSMSARTGSGSWQLPRLLGTWSLMVALLPLLRTSRRRRLTHALRAGQPCLQRRNGALTGFERFLRRQQQWKALAAERPLLVSRPLWFQRGRQRWRRPQQFLDRPPEAAVPCRQGQRQPVPTSSLQRSVLRPEALAMPQQELRTPVPTWSLLPIVSGREAVHMPHDLLHRGQGPDFLCDMFVVLVSAGAILMVVALLVAGPSSQPQVAAVVRHGAPGGHAGERVGEASHPGPSCPGCSAGTVERRLRWRRDCSICASHGQPGQSWFQCSPCGADICARCIPSGAAAQASDEDSSMDPAYLFTDAELAAMAELGAMAPLPPPPPPAQLLEPASASQQQQAAAAAAGPACAEVPPPQSQPQSPPAFPRTFDVTSAAGDRSRVASVLRGDGLWSWTLTIPSGARQQGPKRPSAADALTVWLDKYGSQLSPGSAAQLRQACSESSASAQPLDTPPLPAIQGQEEDSMPVGPHTPAVTERQLPPNLECPLCTSYRAQSCARGLVRHLKCRHAGHQLGERGAAVLRGLDRGICTGCSGLRSVWGKQCWTCGLVAPPRVACASDKVVVPATNRVIRERGPGAETSATVPLPHDWCARVEALSSSSIVHTLSHLRERSAIALAQCLEDLVAGGELERGRSKLLFAHIPKGLSRRCELEHRFALWQSGQLEELLTRVEEQARAMAAAQHGNQSRAAAGRARALAQEGAYSKAFAALTSSTADLTEDEQRLWADKLLPSSADGKALSSPAAASGEPQAEAMTEEHRKSGYSTLRKRALGGVSFPALSAPVPSGARPEHLNEALLAHRRHATGRLLRAIATLVERGKLGQLPASAHWITQSRLVFLRKDGSTSPRPIRIGEVWRRVIAKRLVYDSRDALRERFIGARQCGVSPRRSRRSRPQQTLLGGCGRGERRSGGPSGPRFAQCFSEFRVELGP